LNQHQINGFLKILVPWRERPVKIVYSLSTAQGVFMTSKIQNLILIGGLVLAAGTASARNFFQAKQMLTLTYTSIDTGTKPAITKYPFAIRFSDDNMFCRVYAADAQFDCVSTSSYPSRAAVATMTKQNWLALLNQFTEKGLLASEYNEKLKRILTPCKECDYYAVKDRPFTYQIDDGQPEAFHLTISDMTAPEPMSQRGTPIRY
jgi:hypothetical protein